MTDFKITPEDVGRVAVDLIGDNFRIVEVRDYVCALHLKSKCYSTFCVNGAYFDNAAHTLTHWKPRTLTAPKRWWNVHIRPEGRSDAGKPYAHDFDNYDAALEQAEDTFGNQPVARIYDHHWHGHPEGTFHTSEDELRGILGDALKTGAPS